MMTRDLDVQAKPISTAHEYSVYRQMADGATNIVCNDVSAEQAAKEFYRCSNNVSALTGIVEQVVIKDGLDKVNVAWVYGRGYTYDGERFYDSPAGDFYEAD